MPPNQNFHILSLSISSTNFILQIYCKTACTNTTLPPLPRRPRHPRFSTGMNSPPDFPRPRHHPSSSVVLPERLALNLRRKNKIKGPINLQPNTLTMNATKSEKRPFNELVLYS